MQLQAVIELGARIYRINIRNLDFRFTGFSKKTEALKSSHLLSLQLYHIRLECLHKAIVFPLDFFMVLPLCNGDIPGGSQRL